MTAPAIVSVHDVMPSTLPRVLRILKILEEAGVPPPTLLVVPGLGWQEEQLDALRSLAGRGFPLAGHGWSHKAVHGPRTLFHRGHALLISRDEAEHLSRSTRELSLLVRRCHAWFPTVDLPSPELYVPPAWAMGSLDPRDLSGVPFRWVEVLRGIMDCGTGRLRWLPLAGFEADTTFRRVGLRLWNGMNAAMARLSGAPLRISIHPGDLDLLLGEDLKKMVAQPWRFVREAEIMGPLPSLERA